MGRHIATVWSRDMSLVHVLHCQFNLIRMVCGHVCSLSYVIDQVIELHFLFKVISEQGKYGVCALHIPQYVNCMCTTVCTLQWTQIHHMCTAVIASFTQEVSPYSLPVHEPHCLAPPLGVFIRVAVLMVVVPGNYKCLQ